MTGDKELPEGEMSETSGGDEVGSGGPDRERSGGAAGAKNPTWRTLGSLTVRGTRRDSIWGLELGLGFGFGGFRRRRELELELDSIGMRVERVKVGESCRE